MNAKKWLTVLVVGAGATAAFVALRPADEETGVDGASIFKTATVEVGDLTTTEQLDGSVVDSSVTPVLHRIEGATSAAAPSASASSPAASAAVGSTEASTGATESAGADQAGVAVPQTEGAEVTEDSSGTSPLVGAAGDVTVDALATAAVGATASTTRVATVPGDPTASVDAATHDPSTPGTTAPPAATPDTTTPDTSSPETSTSETTLPAGPTTPETTAPATAPSGGPTFGGRGGAGSVGGGPSGAATGGASEPETGTLTSVAAAGTTVALGDVLYTVEGRPVVGLSGALPAWRTLSTSSDDGPDVAQLELSLASLGYDPDGTMVIDQHFDSSTRKVVRAWQNGLGLDDTGEVTLGSVVFLATSSTVVDVTAAVGDEIGDGDEVIALATDAREVVVDVPSDLESAIAPGLEVDVDGVTGTVVQLRSTERDGAVVVQAVIAPAAPLPDVSNGSSVGVRISVVDSSGALLVPAEALVSRLDGSYALEVQDDDGTAEWVTVELTGVSGSRAAVSGEGISAGTTILLPA